ncbi:MAG: hypothetical protein P1V51_09090 [Deltaproteobacteria bacterium]|nr:hypothetical protein [Deltaproteobacteria bacterium]
MARTASLPLLALSLLLLSACGDGRDGPCADTASVIALPTPLWGAGEAFGPPANDAAAELLLDGTHPWPEWYDQLGEPRGWPRRPLVVVPLSGAATEVDASALTFLGAREPGGELEEVALLFEATLEDEGRSLIVKGREPAPAGLVELVLVIAPGALAVDPLPACDAEGLIHVDYVEAKKRLPRKTEAALALPMPLSGVHQELQRLHDHLVASPALAISSMTARPLDDYLAGPVDPAVAAAVQPTTAYGLLSVPDYAGSEGFFELDAEGLPIAATVSEPGFIVTLPTRGTAPYPVVFFQHGAEGNKYHLFSVAAPLAAAGFAFVAIDLPFHGDRSDGSGLMSMIDFANPLATRDALRQASADQITVITGLGLLDGALEPVFGAGPHLDASRVYFMGNSMGAISGSLSFSVTPEIQSAALFVGGAGFGDLADYGLFKYFLLDVLERPPVERAASLSLMELMVEGGDAFAYALHAEDPLTAPRPALFFQAIDDAIVIPEATEAWARGFGAALAQPQDHPVAGLEAASLPAADNLATEAGVGTRLLLQYPKPAEVPGTDWHGSLIQRPDAQAVVVGCFTGVEGGEPCTVRAADFQP